MAEISIPVPDEYAVMSAQPSLEMHEVDGVELILANQMSVSDIEKLPGLLMRSDKINGKRKDEGALIPIGGAATRENLSMVAKFVQEDTDLVIITTPTKKPDQAFEEHEARFREVGIGGEIHHLREGTPKENGNKMLARASVIYIVGGDQQLALQKLEAEGLIGDIQDFFQRGNTVAGSSAGASIMGSTMPYGDELIPGLGLIDIAVDQHVKQRKRKKRVVTSAMATPNKRAFGVDEGTGAVIYPKSGSIQTFGSGEAYFSWKPNGHQELVTLQPGVTLDLRAPVANGHIGFATSQQPQAKMHSVA